MIDFGTAIRRFYANYTVADGRSPRAEYWWVQLYYLIVYGVLATIIYLADGGSDFFAAIMGFIDGDIEGLDGLSGLGFSGKIALFAMVIFALVNIIPEIMLQIRRFHDLGQTGWLVLAFFLASIVPVIGTLADIASFIWFLFPGTKGANDYGPDPYGHDMDIFG